jgi:tetratricopeptide (TPR) repeat protein
VPPAALVRAITRLETRTMTATSVLTRASTRTVDAVVASSSARTWPDLGAAESRSGAEWYGTAKGHYDARRFSASGECYERAAKAGYRTDVAWYNAACSYALDGQTNRALGALHNALDEGFKDEDLLQTDTDLNAIRGDSRFRLLVQGATASDQAEKRDALRSTYRSMTDSRDTSPGELRSMGISLMRAGDTERAAEAFRREFALDSSATSIYNEACAHAIGRQTAKALEALERSILSGYGDADKLTSDADLSSLRGQPQFDRLVKLADDLSLNFGFMDGKGTWRGRLSRCERVAREHPDWGRAWWNLGFAQLRADEPERSQESFRHALDLGYRVSNTLYNMACAAAQSGDVDKAFALLSRSAAGMDLAGHAPTDSDLEPLHSDRRWRAMEQEWRRQRAEGNARKAEKKADK